MKYYAQLNIIAIILCFIIQRKEARDKQEIFNSKAFHNILMIIELILFLDTVSLLIQNDSIPHNYYMHLNIMNGYFILQALFPLELIKYCIGIDKKKKSKTDYLIYLPFIFTVITVICNSFRPFAYRIAENDQYTRMSPEGFIFIIIWPIFYILTGIAIIARNYKKSSGKKKEIYGHIIVFGIFAFAAGVASTVFNGILLWPLIALDLIYLYINILSKANRKLDILAFRDSLTGVGNAASYESVSEHVTEQIEAGNAVFALVVMDANGLKFINDTYGHEAGNNFIRACAEFICKIFVHSPVFRIGGDEFISVLEKSDYEKREDLLRKFDELILLERVNVGDRSVPLSIARGISVYEPGMSFSEVFYKADSMMYLNKAEVKKKFNIPSR
ncbi:MAG: GGDEF domain-containing protein [Oscillospiraceae bacterium]|nr:GGDEF domain-containing protein [Oscillospiraceae bacterium]